MMLRLFIFSILSMCVLIGNTEAKSRNPRSADFDEIVDLVQEDSDDVDPAEADSYRLQADEGCGAPRKYLRVDHTSGTIKFFQCVFGILPIREKAYINELELSESFVKNTTIHIPCRAGRDCNWGNLTPKNEFRIHLNRNSQFRANRIVELLKPN